MILSFFLSLPMVNLHTKQRDYKYTSTNVDKQNNREKTYIASKTKAGELEVETEGKKIIFLLSSKSSDERTEKNKRNDEKFVFVPESER